MRILLISGEFPPMHGGVGDYSREMTRAFAKLGHVVWILVPASLAEHYPDDLDSEQPWHILAIADDWRWGLGKKVQTVVRDIRPDVINIQYQAAAYDMRCPAINILPWQIKRWRRRLEDNSPQVVTTFHDLKTPYLFPKAGFLRHWAVRILAKYSDRVIVTNVQDLQTAQAWATFALDTDYLEQIPIGSNIAVAPPDGFQREIWRSRLGYDTDNFVWAYFGFLNESKGGETLIRAFAKTPVDHQLLMIGDQLGSSDPTNQAYAEHLTALIDELGVRQRIQWTGFVPTKHVSAALLSADIVVLPYRDGLSFRRGSLHAALAHGCAIISTEPHLSLTGLNHKQNVLLTPPDDPEATFQAAQCLYKDPDLRQRIAKGAQTLSKLFSWDHIAKNTTAVFESLLLPTDVPDPD